MNSNMIPFILRDTLLCFVFILGMVAGILAITRRQQKVGTFVLVGFALLGVDPLAELVIFNILSPKFSTSSNYPIFNWVYACIGTCTGIFGILSVLAGIYFALQPQVSKKQESDSASEQMTIVEIDKGTK